MKLLEEFLNQYKCSLTNDDHVAIEPVILSCNSNACKQCILESKKPIMYCHGCNNTHFKKELLNAKLNKQAETLTQQFLPELVEYFEYEIKSVSESKQEKSMIDELNQKIECIQSEMAIRLESLVASVYQHHDKCKNKLNAFKIDLEKLIKSENVKGNNDKINTELSIKVLKEKQSELKSYNAKFKKFKDSLNQFEFLPSKFVMNEADYGICKDKDFSSEDRLVLKKNYFSTESQLPNLPNSITSNLIQSQTTNVFSQASISLIKINTLESAPKGGFISSLSNETTINDQSKRFSYDNLIPTSQLFGNIIGNFASQKDLKPTIVIRDENEEDQSDAIKETNVEEEDTEEDEAHYTKRMKLYYFNTESNEYVDRGIGNLQIKLKREVNKTELIIRSLSGVILLHISLTKQTHVSKISKNKLLIACFENPQNDTKTLSKFLIQVKTEDDTDELLVKINEMKY